MCTMLLIWFYRMICDKTEHTHTQLFAQNNKSSQLTVMDNIVWVLTGAERKKKTEKRKHKNLLDFTNLIVDVCCCRTSSNH